MIRAPLGNSSYWTEWVLYGDSRIDKIKENLKQPPGNADYRPQYVFDLAQVNYEQIIRRYSRGDSISTFAAYFPPMLDAWEESQRLGREVWTAEQQYSRQTWAVNFDHYVLSFWLVGLALVLDIPDDQWQRLLALIGNEGEDVLLDRVIASRSADRKIGTELCFEKPYARLLAAVDAPVVQQGKQLKVFVDHWYKDLARIGKSSRVQQAVSFSEPYWYNYGKQNFEGGAYFGEWCIEAVAVVKAFGLDDALCLGHEHYPGDLLRPGGPSTHRSCEDVLTKPEAGTSQRAELGGKVGFFAKLFGKC